MQRRTAKSSSFTLGSLATGLLGIGRGCFSGGFYTVHSEVEVAAGDLSQLAKQSLVVAREEFDDVVAARVRVVLAEYAGVFLENGRGRADVRMRQRDGASHLRFLQGQDGHDLLRCLQRLLVGRQVRLDAEFDLIQRILNTHQRVGRAGLRVRVVLVQVSNNLCTLLGDCLFAFCGRKFEFSILDDLLTNFFQIAGPERRTGEDCIKFGLTMDDINATKGK